MKTAYRLLAMLAMCPSMARGQVVAPALPTMEEVRDRMQALQVPAVGAAVQRSLAVPALPPVGVPVPSMDGAQLRGKLFSSTLDVEWPVGKPFGSIENEGGGKEFRDMQGNLIAKSSAREYKGTRTITVTGADGAVIGTLIETEASWDGDHAFTAKDAAGAEIGKTATIGYLQNEYAIAGAGGNVSVKSNHWFYSSWLIEGSSDGRLTAMLIAYNSDANSRESGRRHRDRIGDRPGRGDR